MSEPIVETKFIVGEAVEKVRGYVFPGVIKAVAIVDGVPKYTVEHACSKGLLHIYSDRDLQHRTIDYVMVPTKREKP